ncbi:MAG: methyltransferase domain-containing protein [Candidatus Obscuribacterales bacterium]|nr:methyltransferase domain-containing protein [Candidatus Obscuribacterales bacterium]
MILRSRVPELMDDPTLDDERHFEALKGLEKINSISNGALFVWKSLHLHASEQSGGTLRVLDIATGGGDTPISLALLAERSGLSMQIDGCDFSERAVNYAAEKAENAGTRNRFFILDALKDELPQSYDVITCSLFMHHLDPEQVIVLLKKMAQAAQQKILVNDLLRSSFNLMLVTLASRLLCSSQVVHHDGPVSVRAAYTMEEMDQMATAAGLDNYHISSRFPCRYLLDWSRR